MQKLPKELLLIILENTPSCVSLFRLTHRRGNIFRDNPLQLQNFWKRAILRDFPVLELRNHVDYLLTWSINNGKSLEQLYFRRLLSCYFPEEQPNKSITFTNLYDRLPPSARIALAAAQGDLATIIRELAKHLNLSTELEDQLKTLTLMG